MRAPTAVLLGLMALAAWLVTRRRGIGWSFTLDGHIAPLLPARADDADDEDDDEDDEALGPFRRATDGDA